MLMGKGQSCVPLNGASGVRVIKSEIVLRNQILNQEGG